MEISNGNTNSHPQVPRWTPSSSPSRPILSPTQIRQQQQDPDLGTTSSSFNNKSFPFSLSSNNSMASYHPPPPVKERPDLNGAAGEGLLLTWKDLSVTVPAGDGQRAILEGVTGYAQPGELLAVMGPSGCGKSTLLDALAGRSSLDARQTGGILVNGRKQALAYGTSAYVTQDDTLMNTLTVREAVHYSAQLQLADSMSWSEKAERASAVIREMGLQDAADTRIGGWNVKGISGGQKRRLSICIEILTRPNLLFLDEPTSGLDSAASFHVTSHLLKLAVKERMTVVVSLHQPSSEVFQLFHNLCLLANGKLVYFGPNSAAAELFALSGFPCPSLRNPSDHYLRIINNDFEQDIEQGLESGGSTSTEAAINILVSTYKSSTTCQQVEKRVSAMCQQKGDAIGEKMKSKASSIRQSVVLTKRSFVNMYRDVGYYWLRLGIYVALCLCIFLRERLNGHYGVGAYVIGNTLSSIPYLFMISLVPGAIAYYLVGLQRSFNHFIYFVLLLFTCMLVVESLMMIVASLVPDFLMGIITGAGIQGVMMLNGGFFRLPNDLPKPVWRYPMYYIAFHKYANQGFYKNEFKGLSFPSNQAGDSGTITGVEILKTVWQVEMGYSKWVDLAILLGMVVVYRLMFFIIIKVTEKIKAHNHSSRRGKSKSL
ncbi:hypothetical protein V2J09_009271 [Rumex salicifolius]